MCFTKWLGATLAIALMAGTVTADTVTSGHVKSVNADNKTFVVTDATAKDQTFKFGDNLVVNRAGKESKSDLQVGDLINICYDKGAFTWTAHYILVREGAYKTSELFRGNVKGYDASKHELTLTDELKKDSRFPIGKALVRFNMQDGTIDSVKIGDHALVIVDMIESTPTLRSVMIDRVK